MRLARSHVDLAKAELGQILDEVKGIAAYAGMIVAVAIFMGVLVSVGSILFFGEWLFGSMGWGVVDGALLCIGLIVLFALRIVEAPTGRVAFGFVASLVIGILVAVALGSNVARTAAQNAATQLRTPAYNINLDPTWDAAIVGVVVGAVIVAILGLLVLGRVGGIGGALFGFVLGAILGALLGWAVAGLTFSWQGAAAIGAMVGLILWPLLMLRALFARGFDPTARFRRLYPQQSYDAAMETKAWLEDEWAKRRAKLGSR